MPKGSLTSLPPRPPAGAWHWSGLAPALGVAAPLVRAAHDLSRDSASGPEVPEVPEVRGGAFWGGHREVTETRHHAQDH